MSPPAETALVAAYQPTHTDVPQAQADSSAAARRTGFPSTNRAGRKKKAPYCALCGKKGHYRATCKVLSRTPGLLDRYAAQGEAVPVHIVQQSLKQDMKALRRPNPGNRPSGPKKARKEPEDQRRASSHPIQCVYEREVAERRKELQRLRRRPRREGQKMPMPEPGEAGRRENDPVMAPLPEVSEGSLPGGASIKEEEEIRILRIKRATSHRMRPSATASGLERPQYDIEGQRSPVFGEGSSNAAREGELPPSQVLGEEERCLIPQENPVIEVAERRSPFDWMRHPHAELRGESETEEESSTETSSTTSEDTEEQKEAPRGGRTAIVSRKYTTVKKETLEITIKNEKS